MNIKHKWCDSCANFVLLKEQISQKYVLRAQHLVTTTSVIHVLLTFKIIKYAKHEA